MGGVGWWSIGETLHFQTLFYFSDEKDFLEYLLPGYRRKPEALIREIGSFLQTDEENVRIALNAGRRMKFIMATVFISMDA